MKQILNRRFPFGTFKAMAVWPLMFVRRDRRFTEEDITHEEIHGAQQKELALVGFYVLYALCWLKELVHCALDKERGQIIDPHFKKRNLMHRVAHSIIFEREAYAMQGDALYLGRRRFWWWVRF
jgi:hypothetical protein